MSRSEKVDLTQEGNGLVSHIPATRAEVKQHLRVVGARRRRLVTMTISAAALSTSLAALAAWLGPALAEFFKEQFGPETATIGWRMLCVLAAGCSLTAAVATQLQTSKNYERPIAQAQEVMASLDELEAAITLGHLDRDEATGQYLKIIKDTSFIHHPG